MKRLANTSKFPRLVGVVHLPALPGAPRSSLSVAAIAAQAVAEARLLEGEGFEAIILENFGDVPFFKDQVPPITTAAMTRVAAAVRAEVEIPIGINVLRNDARAALAIASATDCEFIRVNVLSGVSATDQGIIEGDAAALMRERRALELSRSSRRVEVWADALVKHAQPLSVKDVELAVEEVGLRAGADAVIVTGSTTGRPIDLEKLQRAASASHADGGRRPLYLGSGTTAENLGEFLPYLHGVIVGSTLRAGGRAGAKLERARVKSFAKSWRATI